MPRESKTSPQWWTNAEIPERLRARILAQFTLTRDGYTRWYKGDSRFVCGKRTPPGEVEERWKEKQKIIDAEIASGRAAGSLNYRIVLSRFMDFQESRLTAARNRLSERTYHNYDVALNGFGSFRHGGQKVADMDIRAVGPEVFSAYARTFKDWKSSGFDSVVCRVGALFRWAAEHDYIDRYRPGPEFVRPAKQDVRDERIELEKSFTAAEVAQIYHAANHTLRCFIALAVCGGFINSDIGHVERDVIGAVDGICDYRRRKKGKIRRVIPWPDDVLVLLRSYRRPDPADKAWGALFFITTDGNPYARSKSRDGTYKPSDSVSRLFARLLRESGVEVRANRNFTGLRTTFYNSAPVGYEHERAVVMGRAMGTVDLDSYLEKIGLDRLRHVVNSVWALVKTEIDKLSTAPTDAAAPVQPAPAGGVPSAQAPAVHTAAPEAPAVHPTTAP